MSTFCARKTKNLRLQLDELEQYERLSLIRVSGIPETPEESTTEKLLEVTSSVGVALTSSDIVTSHRVGDPRKQRQSPRQIIVRLQSTDVKFSLMKEAGKKLRNQAHHHQRRLNKIPRSSSVLVQAAVS